MIVKEFGSKHKDRRHVAGVSEQLCLARLKDMLTNDVRLKSQALSNERNQLLDGRSSSAAITKIDELNSSIRDNEKLLKQISLANSFEFLEKLSGLGYQFYINDVSIKDRQ